MLKQVQHDILIFEMTSGNKNYPPKAIVSATNNTPMSI